MNCFRCLVEVLRHTALYRHYIRLTLRSQGFWQRCRTLRRGHKHPTVASTAAGKLTAPLERPRPTLAPTYFHTHYFKWNMHRPYIGKARQRKT